MRRSLLLPPLAIVVALLAGCGNKGPLVMPQKPVPVEEQEVVPAHDAPAADAQPAQDTEAQPADDDNG